MLKDHLDAHNFAYTEILVDDNKEARAEMAAVSGGFLGTPFVVIEKDGQTYTVVGFDKNKINELLGLPNE
jgi:glutaredoxin